MQHRQAEMCQDRSVEVGNRKRQISFKVAVGSNQSEGKDRAPPIL